MDYFNFIIFLIYLNPITVKGFNFFSESDNTTYCPVDNKSENCTSHIPITVDVNNTNSPIHFNEIDFCTPIYDDLTKSYLLPYDINFLKAQRCIPVCTKTYVGGDVNDETKLLTIKNAIRSNYNNYWHVGNISVVWCYNKFGKMVCDPEFPIGCYFNKETNSTNCADTDLYHETGYYLFNHITFLVTFRSEDKIKSGFPTSNIKGQIRSVKIMPESFQHDNPAQPNCRTKEPMFLQKNLSETGKNISVTYTYSVSFQMDNYIYIPEVISNKNVTDEFEQLSEDKNSTESDNPAAKIQSQQGLLPILFIASLIWFKLFQTDQSFPM